MRCLNRDKVTSILFVFCSFLHTFQFHNAKIPLLGNLSSLIVLYASLILKGKVNAKFLIPIIVIFLLYIIYIPDTNNALGQITLLFYYISIILFINLIDLNELYQALSIVIKFYIPLSIVLYYLGIGIDSGYGIDRMHGLLSEPSAFTFLTLFLFIEFLIFKNYLSLTLATISAIYVNSLTLYTSIVISLLLISFIKANNSKKIIILFTSAVTAYSTIIIFSDITSYTSNSSVIRMASGIQYLTSLGDSGHNPRGESVINVINYSLNNNPYIGMGLDAGGRYADELQTLRDLNFWLELLLAFGIVGLSITLGFTLNIIIKLKNAYNKNYIVLFCFSLVYVTVNSAQGIMLSQYFIMSLLYWLKEKKFIYKSTSKRIHIQVTKKIENT